LAAAASRAASALAAAPTGAADWLAALVALEAFEDPVERADRARPDGAFERLADERERPEDDFDRAAVDPERAEEDFDLLAFELDRPDPELDRPFELDRFDELPVDFDRDLVAPLVRCAILSAPSGRFRAEHR
jgi:hypothetical protein